MTKVSPQIPYQQVHKILVEHCQTMNHRERLGWLTGSPFAALLSDLAPDQSTTAFVTNLLAVAYIHGNGQDIYLRRILHQLQEDLAGHSEYVAQLTKLLRRGDLAGTLFPTGQVTWAEDTRLHRALSQFQRMPTEHVPDPAPLPKPNNIQNARNKDFVGRQAKLMEIASVLKTQQGVAVAAGIGGVGKTQTAIEWVYRYGQYFQGGVLWLDFSSPAAALVSIASAGAVYGWEDYDGLEMEAKVARVCRQWKSLSPTLLIFDNCESVDLAKKYLPMGSGTRALLTSRNTLWREQGREVGISQVDMLSLTRTESIALLQRLRIDLSDENADTIAGVVGDLPLALNIAGRYLAKYRRTSFGNPLRYIEELRANLLEELEQNSGRLAMQSALTEHLPRIRATFYLSWERLRTQEATIAFIAELLLASLAQFAPSTVVPEEWLWSALPPESDERDGVEAVLALRQSGLVESPKEGSVQLHPLIAEIVEEQTEKSVFMLAGVRIEALLVQERPSSRKQGFVSQENWLKHARHRIKFAMLRKDLTSANLLAAVGKVLHRLSLFSEAITYTRKAVSIQKVEDADSLAFTLDHLGTLYEATGNYENALEQFHKGYKIEQEKAPDGIDSTYILHSLAGMYRIQADYESAKKLYERALAIRVELLGRRNFKTSHTISGLGLLHNNIGDYRNALPFFEEVVSIRREMTSGDADLAYSINNLALVHINLENYKVALPLLNEAKELQEEAQKVWLPYPRLSPNMARILNAWGFWHQAQGEYQNSLPYYEEVLSIRQLIFGNEHPDTARALHRLGKLFCLLGDSSHAAILLKQSLTIFVKTLGNHHPKTETVLGDLKLCQ